MVRIKAYYSNDDRYWLVVFVAKYPTVRIMCHKDESDEDIFKRLDIEIKIYANKN